MRIIAFVTDVGSIPRILAYLREPTQAPRIAPAAPGPPPFEEDFEPRKGTDLSKPLPEFELDQRGDLAGAIPTPNLPVYVTRPAPVGSRPGIRPSPVRHPEALTATQNSPGIGANGLLPHRAGPPPTLQYLLQKQR